MSNILTANEECWSGLQLAAIGRAMAGRAVFELDGKQWTVSGIVGREVVFTEVVTVEAPSLSGWSGEGLPPVGTVCEAYDYTDGKWVVGKILMHGNSDHAFATGTPECWGALFWACKFRPARTPEQIAAELREKEIEEMLKGTPWPGSDISRRVCEHLHAQGYRKQEQPK